MQQNNTSEKLYTISINYQKADVQTRGDFSLSKENQILLLEEAKRKKIHLFVLSTCNRTEITGFAKHPFILIDLLCTYSQGSVETFAKVSTVYKDKEAVNHLFRISTGLESQILGDYEIIGQLKMAFKLAKELAVTNSFLERLLNSVLQASKKVKNNTKLSAGTTSVSYAAVQYIIKNAANYNTKNILVYGLGKMGKHTCKNLSEYTKNTNICLINRTEKKATDFVKANPFLRKENYEALTSEIQKTDILIVSTGASTPTITEKHIQNKKNLLILDLSIPKNVALDAAKNDRITLVNVDELSKVTDKTLAMRKQEIPKTEKIIEKHKQEFYEWINHRKFVPAVSALKNSLESIQKDAIDYFKKKNKTLHVEDAELVTSQIIQKITTKFVQHLKENDTSINQSIAVMQKVFSVKKTHE